MPSPNALIFSYFGFLIKRDSLRFWGELYYFMCDYYAPEKPRRKQRTIGVSLNWNSSTFRKRTRVCFPWRRKERKTNIVLMGSLRNKALSSPWVSWVTRSFRQSAIHPFPCPSTIWFIYFVCSDHRRRIDDIRWWPLMAISVDCDFTTSS